MSFKGKKGNIPVSSVIEFCNTLGYVLFVIGVSLVISTLIIISANDALALVKSDNAVTVTLQDNISPAKMTSLLKETGVINHKLVFRIFLIFKDVTSFEKGTFELNSSMDYGQIVSILKRTKTGSVVRVTIPEGYTLKQIAQVMEDSQVCSADDFIRTANTYDFAHELLKDVPLEDNRLEGYLFPDTYDFYVNENTVSVINKMLNNFEKKYTQAMRDMTREKGKSTREIIIIASLIEKEARWESERAVISGVIYNRLKAKDKFPRLQIDATVMYVTGHKDKLTAEDLATDSPYNTYMYSGLPPTAICNPGLPSILAAIAPESNGYYYYVVNPETGGHLFAKTLSEHNANVQKMSNK